jgi:hypothetical protein
VDRFAGQQAENLNTHAVPVQNGSVWIPGIRIQDACVIRLLDPGAIRCGAAELSARQSAYDLRRLEGHGLVEREAGRYAYHLTGKGQKVAMPGWKPGCRLKTCPTSRLKTCLTLPIVSSEALTIATGRAEHRWSARTGYAFNNPLRFIHPGDREPSLQALNICHAMVQHSAMFGD